jgi:hypothetical protein
MVYIPVMRREEKEVLAMAPRDYVRYRDHVPFFFPVRIPASWPRSQSRFSWSRVLRNREQNALLGFLLVSAYLIIRVQWL